MNALDSVGKMVKTLRLKQGMTQAELAEKLNFHMQYISNIERGLCNIPKLRISDFAKALGVSKSTMVDLYLNAEMAKAKDELK